MKVLVHYNNDRYIVPCGDGKKTVEWLINETVARANRSKVEINTVNLQARIHENNGILFREDKIVDVLEDNSLIYIGIIYYICILGWLAHVNRLAI